MANLRTGKLVEDDLEPWHLPHMAGQPNDAKEAPAPAEAATELGSDESGEMFPLRRSDLIDVLLIVVGMMVAVPVLIYLPTAWRWVAGLLT